MFGRKKQVSSPAQTISLEDMEAVWNWCDNLVVEAKELLKGVDELRERVADGEEVTAEDVDGVVEANLAYVERAVRYMRQECRLLRALDEYRCSERS